MSYSTLIQADQLHALPEALVVDVRFDLSDTQAGERAYAQGHIPGAHYLHLDQDLSGPQSGSNGRHPLPDRQALTARLRGLGLRAGQQVVIYDAQGGMVAARLWWLLRWLGHSAVAVLDGGINAWTGPLTTTMPRLQDGDFSASASLTAQVEADWLQAHLGQVRLLDARAPERFRGEVEPLDPQAGHIPGARNRFFKDNLDAQGRFKPRAQLRVEFEALLAPFAPADCIQQCGSGVSACHNLLAMELAGLSGSALYPGSWSQWCSQTHRPIATGA